jgi:tight adherence protein B
VDVAVASLTLAAILFAGAWRRRAGVERFERNLASSGGGTNAAGRAPLEARIRGSVGVLTGVLGAGLGLMVVGPAGLLIGGGAAAAAPILWIRRRRRLQDEAVEAQLADLAASVAVAVRSGLSIPQAIAFAADEAEPPLRDRLDLIMAEQRVGAPLERALSAFADAVGTDDARLLVLILSTHARTGGNLAVALEEVADTLRHRVAARRELRALTAQGRVSGLILGTLPIGFFLVLATTSRQDLGPVYRSPAGLGMVGVGLLLEGLAFLWIRRILRIEA